jgi:hypothetical protein
VNAALIKKEKLVMKDLLSQPDPNNIKLTFLSITLWINKLECFSLAALTTSE